MVIEFLTFDVDPGERDEWLTVEEATWSRFLEQQPGFVRKQMWVEEGNPGQVHAMIEWTSRAEWHAVTGEAVQAVDATMGRWVRDATCRTFDVVRDS